MEVRRAAAADWQESRRIRLRALRDAPLAFASTYEREAGFDDEVWRTRIAASAQFLAVEDDRVVGTATGYVDPAQPADVRLVGMFVLPEARGRRVAGALVEAVVADAQARGFARVLLDVVETNTAARAVYERFGFLPTGRTAPLPHRPDLTELELEFRLSPVKTRQSPASLGAPRRLRRPSAR